MRLEISKFLTKVLENKYTPIIFFSLWTIIYIILSQFRDASLDENIYLGDSIEIANILKRGEWIGNYGIGLHGFLNKLLIGSIFLFTGPSVFIATLSNILFGIGSGILLFRMLLKHFKFSQSYSLLGVSLLFCSYQFLMYMPTFYRDIMALFFLLLTLDSILSKKSKWITGLFLLLLLDSKEHVFYTLSIGLILWVGIESLINNKNNIFNTLKEFILSNIKIFLPSLVFLILMFTTSVIPLNIYNANILGLIDGGIEPMVSNFEVDTATYNRDIDVNEESAKVMPTPEVNQGSPAVVSSFLSAIEVVLSYAGKILYPRTFSFLSIPFLVIVPSVLFAYQFLIDNLKKNETTKIVIPIILFVYLAVYIFHASIGRYILPISPLIFLFFLFFLRYPRFKNISKVTVLVLTGIFILGGLYFEYSFVGMKVLMNILLFSVLLFIYFAKKFDKTIVKYLMVFLVCAFSAGTSLLASYQYGQIRGYQLYGYNRECEKIVSLVKKEERIWINDINWDKLPFILREENLGQAEWKWSLQEWIPKKKLLKNTNDLKTYNFYWGNIDFFREKVGEYNIQKVVYIKLKELNEREGLLLQDRLDILLSTDWLELDMKREMNNKEIYIFNVNNVVND